MVENYKDLEIEESGMWDRHIHMGHKYVDWLALKVLIVTDLENKSYSLNINLVVAEGERCKLTHQYGRIMKA